MLVLPHLRPKMESHKCSTAAQETREVGKGWNAMRGTVTEAEAAGSPLTRGGRAASVVGKHQLGEELIEESEADRRNRGKTQNALCKNVLVELIGIGLPIGEEICPAWKHSRALEEEFAVLTEEEVDLADIKMFGSHEEMKQQFDVKNGLKMFLVNL